MTSAQSVAVLIILLSIVVAAALWTVITTRLLRAVIGLALTSVIVAVLLFMLNAPLAAVFELSVCGGLIPAIFMGTISVTKRIDPTMAVVQTRQQVRKFWCLPVLIILVGIGLTQLHIPELAVKLANVPAPDVRDVLWNLRRMDLMGQIIILMGGAFGVAVLLKESKRE